MSVLEVKDVYKKLGKRQIIKGISFLVKEGEVFGFLGPNGAGKTTTIRMMVGLIAPDKGTISILGHDISKEREAALADVGSVVENPELYTYMTGRKNLIQLARLYPEITKNDIDEVIELVGLKDRIDDKVKKYSLGMKQRLGLAEALLTKPKLLILDEPTNGLDPSGIKEFRNIIRSAAKERNMAVFISSHILSEIQQLCDTVAFIDGGIIKSVESLNQAGKGEFDDMVIVPMDTKGCLAVLKNIEYISEVSVGKENIYFQIQKGLCPKLIKELVLKSIEIEEIYKKKKDLEERYMEVVGE